MIPVMAAQRGEIICHRAIDALDDLADIFALAPEDHVALLAQLRDVIEGHRIRIRTTYGLLPDSD